MVSIDSIPAPRKLTTSILTKWLHEGTPGFEAPGGGVDAGGLIVIHHIILLWPAVIVDLKTEVMTTNISNQYLTFYYMYF